MRETPVDHYYRGLILEALGDPARALDEYQWVMFWGGQYPYPFRNAEFVRHVSEIADRVEEIMAAAVEPATPVPGETPTGASGPQITPTSVVTPGANAGTATITPVPTQGGVAPVPIP